MATVNDGRVLILGAGGPVGAAAISALKDHYQLLITDSRPMHEAAQGPRQSARAPLPELLDKPHENRVVDVSDYNDVLDAVKGVDAVINLTVLRPHPVLAFHVNMIGAYNVAKACCVCSTKRLIHTGPFHSNLGYDSDWWNDFRVSDDIPIHPADDLYAMTKYLSNDITRIFAEAHELEVLTFLYCAFRPREILPEEYGKGVHTHSISWEDTGEGLLYGLRARSMPSFYETFFMCTRLPHGKYLPEKTKRLLDWEPSDSFDDLIKRVDS